jgi:hypothetical protein
VLKRLTVLILGVLAIAALAAGCGDDDSDASGSSDKAEFVKEANALCADQRKQVEKRIAEYTPPGARKSPDGQVSPDQAFREGFRDIGLGALERQTGDLQDLAGEREDKEFNAYIAAVQKDIDEAKDRPPKTGVEFLERFEGSANMARAYGIPKCAYGY